MKISAQLEAIRDVLNAWAAPRGGIASITSNLKDLWSQAELSSQKPRILICYAGQKARGPFTRAAISGRVDRTFQVVVTRGRGFTSERGDTVSKSVGAMDPFLDDLETVEDMIRNLPGVTEEPPVDYRATKQFSMGTMPVDGYLIEFSTANDLTPTGAQTAGD